MYLLSMLWEGSGVAVFHTHLTHYVISLSIHLGATYLGS